MTYNDDWSICQKSLYFDQQDDWQKAHDLVDQLNDPSSAHVHAYLHRKEGDEWNAKYWYRQAKQPFFVGTLQEEWQYLWGLFNGQ